MFKKIRHAATVTILAGFIAAILAAVIFTPRVPIVEAQSGNVSFSLTFQVPISSFAQYITIPNRNQIGHTVNYAYTTNPGSELLANCGIFLDAANNGTGTTSGSNWNTIAASGNPIGLQNGNFSANGYSTFYRLKIPECTESAITITYVGYFSSVPVMPLSYDGANRHGTTATAVSTVVRADPIYATPGVLTSFQCGNPDPTNTAYLQIYVGNSTPSIGPGMMMFSIPAAQTVNFSETPISYFALSTGTNYAQLYAAATTTATGTTAVSTALVCNFQTNATGPYYPFGPPSL